MGSVSAIDCVSVAGRRRADWSWPATAAATLIGLTFAAPWSALAEDPAPRYLWPLDLASALTSTFGEYRSGYFHSGIDLSTWGRTGYPVLAVDDGEIYRVRASGVGYGRAIYLRLADGRVAVYAHLDAWTPALARYVRAEQRRLGRYEVDLLPQEAFPVRRGETLGYTGESGAGPPHLHFEMRGADGEAPLNPLRLGFQIGDHRAPVFVDVTMAPAAPESYVNGRPSPARVLPSRVSPGRYRADTVQVCGPVVMAAHVYDLADDRDVPLAVHRLSLVVDDSLRYDSVLDSLRYAEQHEVDLVYDAARVEQGDRRVRRLYRAPGSTIGVHVAGGGLLRLPPGSHEAEVTARDALGNVSVVAVPIRATARPPEDLRAAAGGGRASPPGRCEADTAASAPRFGFSFRGGEGVVEVRLVADRPLCEPPQVTIREVSGAVRPLVDMLAPDTISVRFSPGEVRGPLGLDVRAVAADGGVFDGEIPLPACGFGAGTAQRVVWQGVTFDIRHDSLYADAVAWAEADSAPSMGEQGLMPLAPAVSLGPPGLVFRNAAAIRFRPTPDASARGAALFRFDAGDGRWSFADAVVDEDGVGGGIRRAGRYCAARDTLPPLVRSSAPAGVVTDRRPPIVVSLEDAGAGLHWTGLSLSVDGVAAVAEWDPEAGELRAQPEAPLATGEHVVRVSAADRVGNIAETKFAFTVSAP
jgi:murein DD-endopeptidase MepM/ murein hydrolase activator NlpD